MSRTPDELIPKALRDQIIGEITAPEYEGLTDTAFHVTVQFSDLNYREKSEGWITVTTAHRIIARECLALLNRDVRNGGSWIFVWYAPVGGTRQAKDAIIFWKDKDGDIICSAEIKNPIGRIYAGERVDFGSIASETLRRALDFWSDLEISETQKRRAAQGQASANPIPGAAVPPESPIA